MRSHLLGQQLTTLELKATKEQFPSIYLCDLHSKSTEDVRKLHSNISASIDKDALGQILEEETVVRDNDMLLPRNVGNLRRGSSRNEDVFPSVLLAGGLHCVCVDKRRSLLDHIALAEQLLVNIVQPQNFPVLVLNQGLPAELRFPKFPSKGSCVGRGLGESRAVHEELLGNASDVHTRTSPFVILKYCHLCAIRCSNPCGSNASRTTSDHNVVIVILRHT
mmetsp:Transcript_5852/g.24594  ORF Transcript_5852/g.24594 Transcript_5852/m.24594 type:complete len:221 (-) Transcript_5852:161-823(-)